MGKHIRVFLMLLFNFSNNLNPEDVALNKVLNRQNKMTEDCTRIIEDLKMLFRDAIKKVKEYCATKKVFLKLLDMRKDFMNKLRNCTLIM